METRKVERIRSAKIHIWMKPALVRKINAKVERRGLSRDGAFEEGMAAWATAEVKHV
jgi:hypothetical protein